MCRRPLIGSLAADLAETDPGARAQLERSFACWETLLRDALNRIHRTGELPATADTGQLAIGLLAAVQGGLLLSQVRRDAAPLGAALDALIDYLACLREAEPSAATPSSPLPSQPT